MCEAITNLLYGVGIQISADDGAVTISGDANSVKAAKMIPQVTESVEGVKSVRCEVGTGRDWCW